MGYSVGIIAQPDWKTETDFLKLGTPKYAFLLSGGNMDGIVNMYTAGKNARREDAYAPGGKLGLRPPRPTIAYTARLKQAHKGTPVIVGGIEASERRFAHYDYLEDKIRRSYLVDSKADMLVYGMGEKPLSDICARFAAGVSIGDMIGIRGTCILGSDKKGIGEHIDLPSYEQILANKKAFADACKITMNNAVTGGKTLVQMHGDRYVIQFPPSLPLSTPEMDAIYGLPFTRRQHPSYNEPVPALSEVQFGITALRGCPGMCAFCAISAHQGKKIQKRSKKSIVEEAERIAAMPEFKGNISDVGGPTANFYDAVCTAKNEGKCTKTCLAPSICNNLKISHKGITEILESVEKVPRVKRVFIRSGIRYDYIMADKDRRFFERLVKKHVSGQLKVAPEHVCGTVLHLMNKPEYRVYEGFSKRFTAATEHAGKKQYLLPYYISSHPGSTLDDAIALACTLKSQGFIPEQVQDFYPTPGTLSTCMYYSGLNPMTGRPVYVATTKEEKDMQRALLHFNQKRNWTIIREALLKAGREDLIGQGKKCLVPDSPQRSVQKANKPRAEDKAAEPRAKADFAKPRGKADSTKPRAKADSTKPWVKSDSAKPRAKADSTKPWVKSDSAKPRAKADSTKPWVKSDSAKTRKKADSAKPRTKAGSIKPRIKDDSGRKRKP